MPKEIIEHKALSWLQRNLWCEISALQGELPKTVNGEIKILKGCWASNEYLAKIFNVKPDTISKAIAGLTKLKLVGQVYFDGRLRIIKILPCLGEKSYADPDKNPDIDAILDTKKEEYPLPPKGGVEEAVKTSQKPRVKKQVDDQLQKEDAIIPLLPEPLQRIILITGSKGYVPALENRLMRIAGDYSNEDFENVYRFLKARQDGYYDKANCKNRFLWDGAVKFFNNFGEAVIKALQWVEDGAEGIHSEWTQKRREAYAKQLTEAIKEFMSNNPNEEERYDYLHQNVKPKESWLIHCKAMRGGAYQNILSTLNQ
jgi:hypothetical protein